MKKNKILTSFLLTAVLTTGFTGAFMAVNASNPANVVYAYTTLKSTTPMMSGKEVVDLQNILIGLGYDCGKADGYYGKNVESAVKNFQKDYGLPVDGACGDKTWNKLFEEVKGIQVKLNTLGFNCGKADGYFGTNTINALKQFQKSQKLKETGICDAGTKVKLFNLNSNDNSNKNGNDNDNKNSNDNDNKNSNDNDNKNSNDNTNKNLNDNSNTNNNSNINITINNNNSATVNNNSNNNSTSKNNNNTTSKDNNSTSKNNTTSKDNNSTSKNNTTSKDKNSTSKNNNNSTSKSNNTTSKYKK